MAIQNSSLCSIIVLLCMLAYTTSADSVLTSRKARITQIPPPTWCVAQSGASEAALQAFIDSCCSQLDCKAIQPGGMCFEPNTVKDHASWALDLNYRTNKVCDISIGIVVFKDPSYGDCLYI